MILKNLLRRATRSLLTVIGIALGVAAVVSLGAMAKGMAVNYGNVIGVSNDLLITQANSLDVAFSNLDQTLGPRIETVAGVTNVDGGVFGWIAVGDTPYFLVYGYEPGSVAMGHYRIVEGKPVTGPKQIAIGQRAADALKKRVDDTLRLNGVPYRIVGIYETGQGMEESGGVVTLEDGQDIVQKPRQVSLFQVGLRPGADIEQVKQRIANLDSDLTVSTASDYDVSEQWSGMLQAFAWSIAAIAILIGGLGMMSAMVMSVKERTREIGTLRAVGWSRNRVLYMILGESIGLSLVGGLLGMILGAALAWLAGRIPGVGAFFEGVFTPGIFVQGLVTALGLGVIGGFFPAWTAANLQPVEALRYEGGAAEGSTGLLARVGSQGFRNLWRRRTRTLISASGIGIGVATLVMLGGLVEGMMSELNGLAGSDSTGSLTVMQRDVADMSLSSLDERVVHAIRAMPQVESVSPFVLGFIMSEEFPFFMFGGLDPNSTAMRHYKLAEGRYIQRPNEIVLGKIAAETYKVGVGDTFAINENRYRVVGITDGQRLRGWRRHVSPARGATSVRSSVLGDVHLRGCERAEPGAGCRRSDQPAFPRRASQSSEFAQNTNDMESMRAMTDAIRMLAMIVGGVVVANTMIMAIYERTRDRTLRRWGAALAHPQPDHAGEPLLCLTALFGSVLGVIMLALLVRLPI